MPLKGELSDLSLAELIEFFCNKRRSGRLTVVYPEGESHLFIKDGAVVHANFGKLRGVEAVNYALTLPNASFSFSAACEAPEQSIDQHWTSVVLEGLRQFDEEARKSDPVPTVSGNEKTPASENAPDQTFIDTAEHDVHAFGVLLSQYDRQSVFAPRRWSTASVVGSVVLVLAGVGVPWGWYTHSRAVRLNQAQAVENAQTAPRTVTAEPSANASPSPNVATSKDSNK